MKKSLTIFLIFFILFFPFFSFSQFRWEVQYPWEAPQPGNLPQYLLYFYRFAIWGSGMLAMFMIIIGGILYMTSGDDPKKKEDAKDRIKMALGGLVLILGSYIILNTINPELTILQLPKIKPSPDEKCIEFCRGSARISGECFSRCQEKIESSLAIWKGNPDQKCPLKNEDFDLARQILGDSCTLSCNTFCILTCKKNYWEFQCKEPEDGKAKSVTLAECKETKIGNIYLKLTYRNCRKACEARKAPIANCAYCCFKSIFTKENFFTPCSDASFEAYKKTCEALWER